MNWSGVLGTFRLTRALWHLAAMWNSRRRNTTVASGHAGMVRGSDGVRFGALAWAFAASRSGRGAVCVAASVSLGT